MLESKGKKETYVLPSTIWLQGTQLETKFFNVQTWNSATKSKSGFLKKRKKLQNSENLNNPWVLTSSLEAHRIYVGIAFLSA